MTDSQSKIPYSSAKPIADKKLSEIAPWCDISNIAGSVRRKTDECGDIELVVIPKITIRENKNLFGEIESTTKIIHPEFERAVNSWGVITKGQPSGRYMQIETDERFLNMDWKVQIDLFMPCLEEYFRIYAIRTGSAEYSKRLANAWVKKGWRGTSDGLRQQRECYTLDQKKWFIQKEYSLKPTLPPVWQTEQEFFRWLGVQYLEAEYRNL